MLGHKDKLEHYGSGQWYESSKNAVACKTHYKNECWICEKHVYSVIFWSKAKAYQLNPVLSKEKTDEVRFEIDRDLVDEDPGELIYENTNVKYRYLENQVPYICGSFTGWRYRKMIPLEEFTKQLAHGGEAIDPYEIAFEHAVSQGRIRKRTRGYYDKNANDYEKAYIDIARIEERLRYVYGWRHFFAKHLRYRRPYCLNSHLFYERPSPDGTLPQDDGLEEIFSDTSEDSETEEEEEQKEEEEVIKWS